MLFRTIFGKSPPRTRIAGWATWPSTTSSARTATNTVGANSQRSSTSCCGRPQLTARARGGSDGRREVARLGGGRGLGSAPAADDARRVPSGDVPEVLDGALLGFGRSAADGALQMPGVFGGSPARDRLLAGRRWSRRGCGGDQGGEKGGSMPLRSQLTARE